MTRDQSSTFTFVPIRSLTMICWLMFASFSYSQTDTEDNSAIHEKMADFAARIEVHATLSRKKIDAKPKLVAKPIFRWTNPERNTDVGNIFIWTVHGRPHATLGIWPEGDKYGYEMQSFASQPFLVRFANGEEWRQRTGALRFHFLKTDNPPNRSATRRLLEMRQILRSRFRAQVRNWDKDNPDQLRFLTNPLFRYGSEKPKGVIDGAVFAFAHGTDPEMLAILEARENPNSTELVWHYALGSATLFYLDAYLDGHHVWTDREKLRDKTYFMRY